MQVRPGHGLHLRAMRRALDAAWLWARPGDHPTDLATGRSGATHRLRLVSTGSLKPSGFHDRAVMANASWMRACAMSLVLNTPPIPQPLSTLARAERGA